MRHRLSTLIRLCVLGCVGLVWAAGSDVGASAPSASLQEQGDALVKNVEDMVAHGGMGDGNAIIHHCAEASRIAEAMVQQAGATATEDARRSLNEVVVQCRRVAERGVQADPGALLNPAIKARIAARQSIRAMGLVMPR